MRYLPHTREDIRKMLQVVGAKDLDALFSDIPADCRLKENLTLPEPLTEWALNGHMDDLAASMGAAPAFDVFMGAGSYNHHIPELARQLLLRSEIFTAYTPYQPEISQGTLQTIYEYQTLVCRLLGMEVANASMYDGASGLAEAMLMAIRVTRRDTVALSKAIHPLYREVVKTYFAPTGFKVVELPFGEDGRTDLSGLKDLGELAGVALQSPNFFGCIEDLEAAGKAIHTDPKTLFVTAFNEPWPTACSKAPAPVMRTSPAAKARAWASPKASAGPALACSPPSKNMCAPCPDGWWAKPWTGTAKPVSCSPWPPASNISGGKRPLPTSAPTRVSALRQPPFTWRHWAVPVSGSSHDSTVTGLNISNRA